jgi:hypothetical protein
VGREEGYHGHARRRRCASYGRNISGDVFHDKVERVGETGKSRCIRKRKGHRREKANCLGSDKRGTCITYCRARAEAICSGRLMIGSCRDTNGKPPHACHIMAIRHVALTLQGQRDASLSTSIVYCSIIQWAEL